MRYDFLLTTYASERLKVLGVWSAFHDEDLAVRPREGDRRGRSPREHMVHQCAGEDAWFRKMLGIDVGAPPLPERETGLGFLARYAEDSAERLAALRGKPERWWEEEATFFDVRRSRAWILVRRIAHTAHHRGQQTTLLRMLGRPVWSTYGPTADTGGLPANDAETIYPYEDAGTLLRAEGAGGEKAPLPEPPAEPVTERPG